MKAIGVTAINLLAGLSHGAAFLFTPAPCGRFIAANTAMLKSKTTVPPRATTPFTRGALRAAASDAEKEPDVTVFDAEGAVSWEDYKKNKPEEYQLNKVDEMTCWETDECPVEDEKKFTKAWQLRSAERNPTTETHFDSEGEWEEENKDAWTKKWYEDVGADDLHEEVTSEPSKDGFGI